MPFEYLKFMFDEVDDNSRRSIGRAGGIYALLAAKQGHIQEAYEVLGLVKTSMIKLNMQIYLLSQMDRLEEALEVLESSIRETDEPTFKRVRPRFSAEVIRDFALPQLSKRLATFAAPVLCAPSFSTAKLRIMEGREVGSSSQRTAK